MSELSKKPEEVLRQHFGEWADRPTTVLAAAIAIVTAVGLALQAASSLGEPLVR